MDAQTPISRTPTSPVSARVSKNLEQYPSYDDSNQNLIIINDSQMPNTSVPLPRRGGRTTMPGASTTDMLNSYYKQQLLGLLYKVG